MTEDKYIDIKLLEKRSADGIVRAFIEEHLKDKACSLATMQEEIKKYYQFDIGKSNLHKIVMKELGEFVERKKVGNTYYYYSREFIMR